MTNERDSQVALVTGAAVRLGRAIAIGLAGAGVDVALHYHRSSREAEETAEAIRAVGRRCVTIQADLRDAPHTARGLFDETLAAYSQIDILVNSAAIFADGPLESLTDDAWDRHLAINLSAPLLLCREFVRRRTPGRTGHIINIADWRALRPDPGHLAYSITKSGLVALTRGLARHLGPEVQVNAVAPGAILPPPGEENAWLDRLAERLPLRRAGAAADVVDAVLFLLRSRFITGEVLHVTGGQEL